MLRPPDRLPAACRKFQARYERGQRDAHLDACDACREFVAFVDTLGRLGSSAPLDDGLRARLRRVPHVEGGEIEIPRVPQLPLPAALRERLRQIARGGVREALPIWIRSPRYAIAASYLLTLLISGTLGNPAVWASEAAPQLDRVGVAWKSVQANGHETWSGIEETAREGVSLTRDFLRTSKTSIAVRWTEIVESFNDQETTDEDGTETEADPSI